MLLAVNQRLSIVLITAMIDCFVSKQVHLQGVLEKVYMLAWVERREGECL